MAVTPRNKERSMSGVLDGAVALVTGAGGGIGSNSSSSPRAGVFRTRLMPGAVTQ